MSLKAKVTHGLKWKVIQIAGKQILSLVVFTTLARLLEPAAFGLVALISVYTYFASMLADAGIGVALVQRKNLAKAHIDSAFWFSVTSNGLLCIATILLAGPISSIMGEPKLTPLLRWASLGLVFSAFVSVQTNLFVKEMDFRSSVIRTLLGNAVGGAVGVGMAVAGFGVWALVGQLLAGSLAGAVFMFTASSYRPSFVFSFKHLRDLFGVGSTVLANAFIGFFASRLDQLVIGRVAGAPTLGLYVISTKVPEMVKATFFRPIVDVSIPALAGLQEDHGKIRDAIRRGMEIHSVVMFAVFVGIAVTARDLVPLLFGTRWISAGPVCSLLSINYLVNALQVFFYPALLASGVTGKFVLYTVTQAAGVFVACIIGIHFGLLYLVAGLIINSLIMVIPAVVLLRHRIGMSPLQYGKPCFIPACGSILMAIVVWLASAFLPAAFPLAVRVAVEVISGAVVYSGFVFIFRRRVVEDLIQAVRRVVTRRTSPVAAPRLDQETINSQ